MTKDYFFASDDKLDRLGYAKFLRNLIEHCDNYKRDETSEAYSIAIDSSWGTGKTYFFKRLDGKERFAEVELVDNNDQLFQAEAFTRQDHFFETIF